MSETEREVTFRGLKAFLDDFLSHTQEEADSIHDDFIPLLLHDKDGKPYMPPFWEKPAWRPRAEESKQPEVSLLPEERAYSLSECKKDWYTLYTKAGIRTPRNMGPFVPPVKCDCVYKSVDHRTWEYIFRPQGSTPYCVTIAVRRVCIFVARLQGGDAEESMRRLYVADVSIDTGASIVFLGHVEASTIDSFMARLKNQLKSGGYRIIGIPFLLPIDCESRGLFKKEYYAKN